MSVVLNCYQTIEDILEDEKLAPEEKLRQIEMENRTIGEIAARYLPG